MLLVASRLIYVLKLVKNMRTANPSSNYKVPLEEQKNIASLKECDDLTEVINGKSADQLPYYQPNMDNNKPELDFGNKQKERVLLEFSDSESFYSTIDEKSQEDNELSKDILRQERMLLEQKDDDIREINQDDEDDFYSTVDQTSEFGYEPLSIKQNNKPVTLIKPDTASSRSIDQSNNLHDKSISPCSNVTKENVISKTNDNKDDKQIIELAAINPPGWFSWGSTLFLTSVYFIGNCIKNIPTALSYYTSYECDIDGINIINTMINICKDMSDVLNIFEQELLERKLKTTSQVGNSEHDNIELLLLIKKKLIKPMKVAIETAKNSFYDLLKKHKPFEDITKIIDKVYDISQAYAVNNNDVVKCYKTYLNNNNIPEGAKNLVRSTMHKLGNQIAEICIKAKIEYTKNYDASYHKSLDIFISTGQSYHYELLPAKEKPGYSRRFYNTFIDAKTNVITNAKYYGTKAKTKIANCYNFGVNYVQDNITHFHSNTSCLLGFLYNCISNFWSNKEAGTEKNLLSIPLHYKNNKSQRINQDKANPDLSRIYLNESPPSKNNLVHKNNQTSINTNQENSFDNCILAKDDNNNKTDNHEIVEKFFMETDSVNEDDQNSVIEDDNNQIEDNEKGQWFSSTMITVIILAILSLLIITGFIIFFCYKNPAVEETVI